MLKIATAAVLVALAPLTAHAAEITVPPGFRATVVFDGDGPARHIAVNRNGDIYLSARRAENAPAGTPSRGILALRDTDGDGKYDQTARFSDVEGTGLRFDGPTLYAASATTLYRFQFNGRELTPSKAPEIIVTGMPSTGFASRGIAFDGKGGVLLSVGAAGNACMDRSGPEPKGADPCPDLVGRAGIWRFDARTVGQRFPQDGERYATGVRDLMAIDWDPRSQALYAVVQGRNGLNRAGAKRFTAEDDALGVAEEYYRVDKGANLGWPYSHFDGRVMRRVKAPEYGGGPGDFVDNPAYATPLAALAPHSSPLDLIFYHGRQFPARYRGGSFVALQGGAQGGYQVAFVPPPPRDGFAKPEVFADGFAGAVAKQQQAEHRPSGVAVGPDGSLYVVDAKTGRVWKITYAGA